MAKLAAYEKQMLASPDQQISLTDPDSRSMATSGRGSGVVGYNVQVNGEEKITTTGKVMNDDMLFYRASTLDCSACAFKSRCCPKEPARKILRSIYEEARDVARALAKTEAFEQSCRERKRIEMLFAHLKRILHLGRLRLRGPRGGQFEFTLAATAQNLRRLAKLMARPPPMVTACVA